MFFAGLARGLNDAATQSRAEEQALASQQAERENRVLEHLASADDPEIASMAVSGLLNQATGKPAKGIRGWFGEMSRNPALPTIRALMQAGRQVPTTQTQQTEPAPSQLPEGSSAALPAGSPVEPGGAPLSMAAVHNTLPQAPGASVQVPGPSKTVPRRPFLTPTERVRANEEAQLGGKLSAFRSSLAQARTPEEIAIVKSLAGIHMPVTGQFMGNAQEPDGSWVRQERFWNGQTGAWELTKIPIATPTGLQAKPVVKPLADDTPGPNYGRPGLYRIMPDGSKTKLGDLAVRDNYVTYTDPETGEIKSVPAPAVFEKPRGGAAAPPPTAGMIGTPHPVAAPGSPASRTLTAAVPPPGPATGAGTGKPGAATPPPVQGAAPVPPAAKGGGPAGVPRGRAKSLKETEGAFIGPDGQPQVGTALFDHTTGKYMDPRNPQQELGGFIPGKESIEAVKLVANTSAVESTLDRAIANIKAQHLEDNDDPNETAKLVKLYKEGKTGDDPLGAAFNALADFAKIQGASQYVQGTRAFRYIQQIQQHLPLLPSYRAAAASALTGGAIGPGIVQAVAGEGPGHQYDSPKTMMQKLVQAKENLAHIREESVKAHGKVEGRATPPPKGGEGGGAAAASASAPDLTSLQPGHKRSFHTGPFAGTSWTIDPSGKPKQLTQ